MFPYLMMRSNLKDAAGSVFIALSFLGFGVVTQPRMFVILNLSESY